jgi:hypothetical protein
MPENVKTRTRTNSRRVTTPDPDTSGTEAITAEAGFAEAGVGADTQEPDAQTRDAAETTPDAGPDTTPDTTPEDESGVTADGAVGWADAVPWLALRHGSAPTAAEVRCAPAVWAMLHEQTGPGSASGTETSGRTVLQMAAEAELAGHTDLDPTTLTRVLVRYERAGVVRSVTDGRLARWSAVDPADVIASAQDSARAGGSTTRARRTGGTTRDGDGAVTPAGGLRDLIADHLAAHPDQDFSPTQIANALGRSSGAIANALERLTEHGAAVQTSTTPRRYQHHTDPAHDGTDQNSTHKDGTAADEVPGDADLDRKAS